LSNLRKRKFSDLQRRLQCVEDENQELNAKVARLQTSNDDLTHLLCFLENSESQIKELKQSLAVEQSKYIALLAEQNIIDFQLARANEIISLNNGVVAQLELKIEEH
jgi:predicted RNase H-like nuclease (RuvC/YqgF family)